MTNRQNNTIGDIPFVLGAYLLWYTGNIRDVVQENLDKILKSPLLGYHMYKCK